MAYIKTEVAGKVFKIIFNRPDKFNSFNQEMGKEFLTALDSAATDKNIRAVLITGEGKAFSAGQDLAEAIDPSGPGIGNILTERYNPVIHKIRSLEKPVVCAVNGVAAGAGANIALACDIVIAAASATFIQAFIKIGLIPDSGGTFFLPRLVGLGKASALAMLGEKVSAADAERLGMIYKVCDDDKLQKEAMDMATALSEMPTKGIALTKQLLNDSTINTLEKQLEQEKKLQVEATGTHDYREGVQAFLEKRKANFKGE
jgi:2-(1,2-epoxy-1,2-dihydrophenyl)acetyl-CoA isomerase